MYQQQEFTSLIQHNQKIIYKVCNLYVDDKTDREDLYQEICLQAWKSYNNFKGDSKFSTWLYKVALNTAITFFKQEKRQSVFSYNDSFPEFKTEDYNDEHFRAMYKAIEKLNKIEKALVMLYLEDYNYEDIGNMLGITANNVAVKMNRLKVKLKEEAEKNLNTI